MTQEADAPSSDAVMMVVPAFFALIIPVELTDAMLDFFELHVGVLPDETVAARVIFSPAFNFIEE